MASESADEHVSVEAAAPRRRSQLVVGPFFAGLFLAAFRSLFLYGGVQVWVGVHQAIAGPHAPGVVRDVDWPRAPLVLRRNLHQHRRHMRNRHVVVQGATTTRASLRATFVPKIDTGQVVGSVQSDDTAHVGGVTLSVVGVSFIGAELGLVPMVGRKVAAATSLDAVALRNKAPASRLGAVSPPRVAGMRQDRRNRPQSHLRSPLPIRAA